MNKLAFGIIAVILILIAGYFLLNRSLSNQQKQANGAVTLTPVPEKVVKVTADGYSPKEVKINKGARIIWINESGKSVTVNSDEHPSHTLYPFLNLGEFSDKSSVQVVFDKTGTFTYHNHLQPGQKGKVIVE